MKGKRKFKLSTSKVLFLIFIVLILIGSFFLMLPFSNRNGEWLNFLDAFFTSASAVCVTGLLKFDITTQFTLFGQTIILLLIQIGALGFMTIATLLFLLLGKKIRLKERMLIKETLGHDSYQGIVKMARKIIIATFLIELVGAIILLPSMLKLPGSTGMALYRSLFMSISSFCNSGFDVMGSVSGEFSSLSYFAKAPLVLLPIAFLIIIGGLGFAVIFDILNVRSKKKSFHAIVVINVTLGLIIFGAVSFALAEWSNPNTLGQLSNPSDKILHSFFLSVTPRSAGYSCFDVTSLTPFGKMLTALLALIGSSPASTGGGIKTTTLFVLLLLVIKGTNQNDEIIYCKRTIPSKIVFKSLLILFFAFCVILTLTLLLCILEKSNPYVGTNAIEALLFESVNTFSTAGMSYGITPYLSKASTMLLCAAMLAGRLGTLAISITILERNDAAADAITYPEGKIMIG